MTNETRKIWDTPDVMAMATCIRVPVMRAHAESINLEFEDDITEDEARELLAGAAGVSIIDDRCARLLPPPDGILCLACDIGAGHRMVFTAPWQCFLSARRRA